MIHEFLILIIISVTASIGFYAATQFEGDTDYDKSNKLIRKSWPKPTDKMIFWWVRYYGGRYLGQFWYKPVYGCLPCMGSLHSIYPLSLFLLIGGYSWWLFLIMWPLLAICVTGINYLIQEKW